jgi:Ca-activated chloride channel family protein
MITVIGRLSLMIWNRTIKKSAGVAVILALICTAAVRAQSPTSEAKSQTLKVDVDLVLVNTTVSDPLGRMVTGLQPENFQLWEDKVEQKIQYFSNEDIPLSIGLIFDATGSMSDKISTARDAAITFLKMGNPEDEFFLVTFSQQAQLVQDFTTDIRRLQNHLLFTPAKGLTPLFDAVYLGLDKMKGATNKRRALLLITDGEDNHSRYSFADIKEFAKERDVQIFAIGIVNPFGELAQGKTGRAVIEDLVDITGGHAFFPESVYELQDICTKIGIELKNQYVLGYHSTNEARDGKWRKIRLKVNAPKGLPPLSVRGKSGYYAETLNSKQ